MASSSGTTSSETCQLQQIMDQRKRKRMLSNRESARRSRQRKQKHLDDLTAQLMQLGNENRQIASTIEVTSQLYLNVEAENSVLRAQMVELNQRLESLNEMVVCLNPCVEEISGDDHQLMMMNPWNLMYVNQPPIMASCDLFIC